MTDYLYIKNTSDLEDLCDRLAKEPRIAVDTEFIGDRTYFRRLEIIQLAIPGLEAIVDYQAVSGGGAGPNRLAPLWDIFVDPAIELVFHAALEDTRVLVDVMGERPVNVFDTQIAFSMIDQSFQIGYLDIVQKLCNQRLDKGPQMLDWGRRPLTGEMIEYALNDVRFLFPVQTKILKQLKSRGRFDWFREIMDETIAGVEPPNPEEAWRKVKGQGSLKGKDLAVLRELAAFREEIAMDRDIPAGRVLADDILVAVARRKPDSERALRQTTRRLHEGIVRDLGRGILAAVAEGQMAPEISKGDVRKPPGRHAKGLQSLLSSFVDAVARRNSIAAQRIVKSNELGVIADRPDHQDTESLPVMQGWRRDLLGADLLAIARGELSLHWDPVDLCLVATDRNGSGEDEDDYDPAETGYAK